MVSNSSSTDILVRDMYTEYKSKGELRRLLELHPNTSPKLDPMLSFMGNLVKLFVLRDDN